MRMQRVKGASQPFEVVLSTHEYDKLKAENAELRAELARIKPSWDDAPNEAEWLAQDSSGNWRWHVSKPKPHHMGLWAELPEVYKEKYEKSGYWGGIHYGVTLPNWRETLERRPEASND